MGMESGTRTERNPGGRLLAGFALLAPALLVAASCVSSNYLGRASLFRYRHGLDMQFGFDRFAFMRVQLHDGTGMFASGLRQWTTTLTMKPIPDPAPELEYDRELGSGEWVEGMTPSSYPRSGDWEGNTLDGVTAVEAKADTIAITAVSLGRWEQRTVVSLGRLGEQNVSSKLLMPLGLTFALRPGCISYLGRLHVEIVKAGQQLPLSWSLRGTVENSQRSIQYAMSLEQSDATMREDLERVFAMHPGLRKEFTCTELVSPSTH